MKHAIRIKRHFIRDGLAFVAGAALVAAFYEKSWCSLILATLNGAMLFVEERADIEEEEGDSGK